MFWVKCLNRELKKLWVVHLLVLEESGSQPKIYTGLGTDTESGVSVRLRQYDTDKQVNLAVKRLSKVATP